MGTVGIRQLRDGLSRYLADVRAGRTLTVTDHGRPVARIVPIEATSRLEQLIAEGKVRPPTAPKLPAPSPVSAAGSVSDLVPDQRR